MKQADRELTVTRGQARTDSDAHSQADRAGSIPVTRSDVKAQVSGPSTFKQRVAGPYLIAVEVVLSHKRAHLPVIGSQGVGEPVER